MAQKKEMTLEQIVHRISFAPHERLGIFLDLPRERREAVLLKLSKIVKHDLINRLPDDELALTLEHLDPDTATDVIQLAGKKRQEKIISRLSDDLKQNVSVLAQFAPETAAGLMNIDYVRVQETSTIADVARQFKEHEKRTGRPPAIIVVRDGKITGYLPGHKLGFAQPAEEIKRYVRKISTIKHNATYADVVGIFKEHPHNKIAVIGDEGNVLGIIYSDDILRVLQEQESASLYDFAGVHEEESVSDRVSVKIKHRYKWLIINLATAFLAAFTVGLFDKTISKFVLLAIYMPIVAGMGGNAATQTLAVLVRGIAFNQITLKNSWRVVMRELGAGFVNGLLNGAIVAAVVIAVNHDYKMAFILAAAMIINLLVASFFGTMVPLVMKKLGKDPATSATIFITTATDVLGFLSFLGLATLLL